MSATIASNAFIASAGRIVGGVFALFTTIFTTRALGTTGFGEYSTAVAFLYIFNAVADFGLYSYLVREISRTKSDERSIVGHVITLRMAFLVVLLVAGIFIGQMLPYPEVVKRGMVFAALSYFFLSSSQVLMGLFQRYLFIWKAAVAEVVSRSIQVAFVCFLFFSGETKIEAFLGILALASFVNFLAVIFFARQHTTFTFGVSWSAWKTIAKESFPIALSLIFTLIYFRLDTVLLSLFKSAHEVGIYNISYKLLENIIFYPAMFVGLLMPALSREAEKQSERFAELLQKGSKTLFAVAVPMVFGGAILARPIIEIVGGTAFHEAQQPFVVLLVATAFIFFGTIAGAAVIALNKQKQALPIYFCAMVFNVLVNLVFIPQYGYMATALTTLATEIIVTVGLCGVVGVRKILPHPTFAIKVFLAGAIMATPLLLLFNSLYGSIGLVFLVPAMVGGPIVFFTALVALGGFSREDFDFLFGRIH